MYRTRRRCGQCHCEDTTLCLSCTRITKSVRFSPSRKSALLPAENVLFHTDAVQAGGHIHIDVKEQNIDMLTLSGHKFHAPKDLILYCAEALYYRMSSKEHRSAARWNEHSGIVMAAAFKSCDNLDIAKITAMRDRVIEGLKFRIDSQWASHKRLPGNISFCSGASRKPCY